MPVQEVFDSDVGALVHQAWGSAYAWLLQGTTTRGARERPLDLGLFSDGSSEAAVRENWRRLLNRTGATSAVHARQPHEAHVRFHDEAPPGLLLVEPCDGHVTRSPGLLLTVSVADCVPVFIVAPRSRTVAALHAGWRGAAAGILERGLEEVRARAEDAIAEFDVHLGPSICGACYEVGPEVHAALGRPLPSRPTPIDLRGVLAARALSYGVSAKRLSVSTHCTRCTASSLFSHRGGDDGRQVGFIGVRS